MLEVTFVRRRGQRDKVYVRHDDGASTGWAFPTYGDALPHDLCHLVVEDELALADGFWGMVAQRVEVALVNNQATLVRDGRPLADDPAADFAGLDQAEAAVAVLAGPAVVVEIAWVGAPAVARLAGSTAVTRLDDADELLDSAPEGTGQLGDGHLTAGGDAGHGAAGEMVAALGRSLPPSATPEAVAAVGRRLAELGERWRTLEDGGVITLPFPSRPASPGARTS
jgi:hypothetical protein